MRIEQEILDVGWLSSPTWRLTWETPLERAFLAALHDGIQSREFELGSSIEPNRGRISLAFRRRVRDAEIVTLRTKEQT